MDPRDAELLAKLLPTFRQEAEEHLRRIETLLAGLSRNFSAAALEEAYREVHSLKGAARSVGAGGLEDLCREMESVFAAIRKEGRELDADLLDLLVLASDLAADLAAAAGREVPEGLAAVAAETGRRLAGAARGGAVRPAEHPRRAEREPALEPPPDLLRIGTRRMEEILLRAEELLADKVTAQGQAERMRELLAGAAFLRRDLGRAVTEARALLSGGASVTDEHRPGRNLRRLQEVVQSAEEAVGNLEESGRELLRASQEHARSLALKIDALLETVRHALMLPMTNLLDPLPRLVRDLARDAGKHTEIEIRGGEIPVDRRIQEEMRDPLLHLLRNAVDHGLETPEERRRLGKPERGRILLEVRSPSPRRVLFTLADDGRGLDLQRLREAAVRDGVLSQERAAALDDIQAAELAFASGLTTLENLTAVSGRGLGLPIVRERVERLGGEITIESRSGEGTTFRLDIPAAVAAFRGILTRLGQFRCIFPATAIERVLRLAADRIAVVEGIDVLETEGGVLPLVRLEQPLRLPLPMRSGAEPIPVVVAASRGGRIGFAVDEVLAEEEFLVKSLGRQLVNVPNFSGTALLGDGDLALVLDTDELIRNAFAVAAAPAATIEEAPARRRILVVEDSITSRTLLRNILEGAGYAVATAVDGVDGLERLASAVFDLVVSDVEMPRMDGFQFTRRIRERFGRLPVVLVTGLERAEDRERGMEAGADAYLVKSRFDQSNLLQVLGRLI